MMVIRDQNIEPAVEQQRDKLNQHRANLRSSPTIGNQTKSLRMNETHQSLQLALNSMLQPASSAISNQGLNKLSQRQIDTMKAAVHAQNKNPFIRK